MPAGLNGFTPPFLNGELPPEGLVRGAACGLGGALWKPESSFFGLEPNEPSDPEPSDPEPSEPEPSEPDPSELEPSELDPKEPDEPREPKDPKESRDSDDPKESEEPKEPSEPNELEDPKELEDSEPEDGPKELLPESDRVVSGPEPDEPIWNISLGLMCFLWSASVKAEADGL